MWNRRFTSLVADGAEIFTTMGRDGGSDVQAAGWRGGELLSC